MNIANSHAEQDAEVHTLYVQKILYDICGLPHI